MAEDEMAMMDSLILGQEMYLQKAIWDLLEKIDLRTYIEGNGSDDEATRCAGLQRELEGAFKHIYAMGVRDGIERMQVLHLEPADIPNKVKRLDAYNETKDN